MINEQYEMINKTTNIVESTCMWDGNTETWTPPDEYLVLPHSQFDFLIWSLNEDGTDYVLTLFPDLPAGAEVGFLYDGTNILTTPEPKPVIPT